MKPDLGKIRNHTPKLIGEEQFFKAAVCIALIENHPLHNTQEASGSYDILFEVRSNKIPAQPGDVCLPGGAVEPGESYEEAALRETCEELLISHEQIELIGRADYLHTGTLIIHPFVGILKNYKGTFQKEEVEEVFRVPLQFFLETEPERHQIEAKVIPDEGFPYELIAGGKNYQWRSRKTEELFYQYDGHVIWGLTARMIYAFCKLF